MKHKFFIPIIFFSLLTAWGNLNAQAPKWQWANSIGGNGDDRIAQIAVDPAGSGDVYAIGFFEGTVDFDPGESTFNLTSNGGWDIFISKLDASGSLLWAISIGGIEHDRGLSIVADGDGNLYVAGLYGGTVDFDPGMAEVNLSAIGQADIFISKLDHSGHLVWVKSIGGTGSNLISSMVLNPSGSGGIYATGYFNQTTDFDPDTTTVNNLTAADYDVFIFKLDGSGDFVWAKSIGSPGYDVGYGIAIDPTGTGSVYTTGSFKGTADFDPDPFNTFNLTAPGNQCLFISKLDASGNFVWAEAMTGPKNIYGSAIATNPSGDEIYITGLFNGEVDFDPGDGTFNMTANGFDFFISKLGGSGELEWAKAIGGGSFDFSSSIAVDPGGSGDVYTTGFFSGTVDFDPGSETTNLSSKGSDDIFISKLDSLGNFILAKSMGGTAGDYGISIAPDLAGQLYVAGYFTSSSISFDSISLTNAVNTGTKPDFFIARLEGSLPSAVPDIYEEPISFYPNPTTSELTVELSSSAYDDMVMRVVSITGQVMAEKRCEVGNVRQTIDVNGLAEGMYFIQILFEGHVFEVKRFVKE